ncbi:plasmid mobilization relaxosome protein MobC [Chondrinema litorale]|uniref:plasmid mobilization relaxosome protein MobC n=1 Tax=Chondrinema litorale TaxID=2994555 RepID=UPI0025432B39|nr:plasmid mobilization relaxosome protein MobC [Chondrinema litorale]UZR99009.1 plasmid mobilization relaxosome protein MobC [Chondrinema litorale]
MQKFTKSSTDGKEVTSYRITVRLSEQQKQDFYAFAARTGVEKSDTEIFKRLLEGSKKYLVISPISKKQMEQWREFVAVGNNINQLAKSMNYLARSWESGDRRHLEILQDKLNKISNIIHDLSIISDDSQNH